MLALLIILCPLYLLALMAIVDALKPAVKWGESCEWRIKDEQITANMRLDLLSNLKMSPGVESPLCGWGYLYQYRNFKPTCEIEFVLPQNEHYVMRDYVGGSLCSEAVKGLMTSYRKAERATAKAERAQVKITKQYNLENTLREVSISAEHKPLQRLVTATA